QQGTAASPLWYALLPEDDFSRCHLGLLPLRISGYPESKEWRPVCRKLGVIGATGKPVQELSGNVVAVLSKRNAVEPFDSILGRFQKSNQGRFLTHRCRIFIQAV